MCRCMYYSSLPSFCVHLIAVCVPSCRKSRQWLEMRSFVLLKASRTSSDVVQSGTPQTLHTQLGVSCPLKKIRYPQKILIRNTCNTWEELEGERRSSQNYFLKGDTFFELLFASWSEFVRFHEQFSRVERVHFGHAQVWERNKNIVCMWYHHKYAYVIGSLFGTPFSKDNYLSLEGEDISNRYASW